MRILVVSFLVVSCFTPMQLIAQEERQKEDERVVAEWMKAYDAILDSYEATAQTAQGTQKLKLENVLTINNPDWGARHGRFCLWTHEGRPYATTASFSRIVTEPRRIRIPAYEFHSLSQLPVRLTTNGRDHWKCEEPGIEWMKGPEDVKPATSARARLIQMRSIARRFDASAKSEKGSVSLFRLVPQPIYRYPPKTAGAIDGDKKIWYAEGRTSSRNGPFLFSGGGSFPVDDPSSIFLSYPSKAKSK